MKLSVSLPDEQVMALDRLAAEQGLPTRSAAVQRAVALYVIDGLQAEYDKAFEEWEASGEAAVWESVAGDGLESDAEAKWW
jgi:metal-responsive CopG/Arc/MetJ family transcriptional regulator